MNTYNDNLQTDVNGLLNNQELQQKSLSSQLTAAEFTLYYSEGATITAYDQLNDDMITYKAKKKVNTQAVINSNTMTNALASATLNQTNVATTVANAATMAANTQVAANSVLDLGADLASINSIVTAADFGTEIYHHTQQVMGLMETTAYNAELATQHAMEASANTSEVTATTVLSKAQVANTEVATITSIAASEFTTISDSVKTDHDNISAASTAEKIDEGKLLDANNLNDSINDAYDQTNSALNYNLITTDVTNSGFTASFMPYQSPFTPNQLVGQLPSTIATMSNPVDCYYLMVCKYDSKAQFLLNTAEALVNDGRTKRYMKIKADSPLKPASKSKSSSKMEVMISPITQDVFLTDLQDVDGDALDLGTEYVVFIMVEFTKQYKKLINTFEDLLLAPSAYFTMTYTLEGPVESTIKLQSSTDTPTPKTPGGKNDKDDDSKVVPIEPVSDSKKTIQFTIVGVNEHPVEYRVILLQHDKKVTQGLMTVAGLQDFEDDVTDLEHIADFFDPKIAEIKAELATLGSSLDIYNDNVDSLTAELKDLNKQVEVTTDPAAKTKLNAQIKVKTAQLNKFTLLQSKTSTKQTELRAELVILENEKKNAEDSIDHETRSKVGFYFNESIAGQVPDGNYTVAKMNPKKTIVNPKDSTKNHYIWEAVVNDGTTDNFGNLIIDGEKYIPAVLTISDALAENLDQYTNTLSDTNKTKLVTL